MSISVDSSNFLSDEINIHSVNSSSFKPVEFTPIPSPALSVFLNIDFSFKQQEYKKNKLSRFFLLAFKISDFILKILSIDNKRIKNILNQHDYHSRLENICKKMSAQVDLEDLNAQPNTAYCINAIFSQKFVNFSSSNWIYKSCKYRNYQILLSKAEQYLQRNQIEEFKILIDQFPNCLKILLCQALCAAQDEQLDHSKAYQQILGNPKCLLNLADDNKKNVFSQFIDFFSQLEEGYRDLSILNHAQQMNESSSPYANILEKLSQKTKEKLALQSVTYEEQLIRIEAIKLELTQSLTYLKEESKNILVSADSQYVVYGSSIQDLQERNRLSHLDTPLTVALVGVEYAGLIKQGGLSEALEGLTRAVAHGNGKARLFFPKYNKIPSDILERLEKTEATYLNDQGDEINVYKTTLDNVECFFIEHESFVLDDKNPNIYGPDEETVKKRFIAFSALAANVLYQMPGNDVIHLHDWHVAGIGLKLAKDHKREWEEGLIPPVVFTFHNNSRCAQGRVQTGPYHYGPIMKALQESGIAKNNDNIFVEIIRLADSVTTVSETFAKEAQLPELGEGIAFAVKQIAKIGKLTGIINGVNTERWNPLTNASLVNWRDVDTQEPINLSFSSDSVDAYAQKIAAKEQLNKWVKRYLQEPKSNFTLDLQKPLVAYIGRFDSYQKGLDKLEDAIEATIKNGGQFVIMGSQEDPEATIILDKLQNKYGSEVLMLRDYKNSNGSFHFQEGNGDMPGIGSVVRAATDFQCVPSRFEPCGLVQFESWLFGSQVIGSRTGGLADTIMTREQDEKHYNGYLFDCHSKDNDGIYHQVSQAIKEWKLTPYSVKDLTIKRLIRESRLYSWSTAPRGLAPVQKYRMVYQQAIQRVHNRKRSECILRFDIQDHLRKTVMMPKFEIQKSIKKEEAYLSDYYLGLLDDKELEERYYGLPESIRSQLPGPHAKRIRFDTYNELGAIADKSGVNFTVNAPQAKKITLKLYDHNRALVQQVSMVKKGNGYWNAYVGECPIGYLYQYEVNDQVKIDPYGLMHVNHEDPLSAPYSVICARDHFTWTDADWMAQRIKKAGSSQPMNIYEIHPTAWKRDKNGKPLNFRELAHDLLDHVKRSGYTHVELMGILEHPYEGSMGYQVTGFFAPNSRLGSLDDFKYLINYFHENGVGIILDWIPAHFSKNSYALHQFDGTKQFEPSFWNFLFSKRRFYPWGTAYFDYTKKDVREFLISNAVYWLKELHIDGLRVDAVRCILDSENQDFAKLFLRELNAIVHAHCQGSITIAEDYSGRIEVSQPAYKEGLGFDMKWNVAWMYHTLSYFSMDPITRAGGYNKLIQAIESDKAHKMVLALSHDEVTETAKTLLGKIDGISLCDSYANVRAMISFMMALPGKKLNFMGNELGSNVAWTSYLGRDTGLMDSNLNHDERAMQFYQMCIDLNHLYLTHQAFWQKDDNALDMEWIEKKDTKGKLIAYRRRDNNEDSMTCLHNLAGTETIEYEVPVSEAVDPQEIFNSDKTQYGGQGRLNDNVEMIYHHNRLVAYKVKVPPLSSVIIKE